MIRCKADYQITLIYTLQKFSNLESQNSQQILMPPQNAIENHDNNNPMVNPSSPDNNKKIIIIDNYQSYERTLKQLKIDGLINENKLFENLPFKIENEKCLSYKVNQKIYRVNINILPHRQTAFQQFMTQFMTSKRKLQIKQFTIQKKLQQQIVKRIIQKTYLNQQKMNNEPEMGQYSSLIYQPFQLKIITNVSQNFKQEESLKYLKMNLYSLKNYYSSRYYNYSKKLFKSASNYRNCEKIKFLSFFIDYQQKNQNKYLQNVKPIQQKQKNFKSQKDKLNTKFNQKTNLNQNIGPQKADQISITQEENNKNFDKQVQSQTIPLIQTDIKKAQQVVKDQNSHGQLMKNQQQMQNLSGIYRFEFSKTSSKYFNQILDSFNKQNITKAHTNQKNIPDAIYILNQFYSGNTLKQLIINNWKGFQNQLIVYKLIQRLFWVHAQIEYYKLTYHISTASNVIIDDSLFNVDSDNGLHNSGHNFKDIVNLNLVFQAENSTIFSENVKLNNSYYEKIGLFLELQDFRKTQNAKFRLFRNNKLTNFLKIILMIICRRVYAPVYDFNKGYGSSQPAGKIKKQLIQIVQQNAKYFQQFLTINKKNPQNNFQKIKLNNLNFKRINQFQQSMLQFESQYQLFQIFKSILTKKKNSNQNTQEDNKQKCTYNNKSKYGWRQFYQILLLKNNKQKIKQLQSSKLLALLCKFFSYSYKQNHQQISDNDYIGSNQNSNNNQSYFERKQNLLPPEFYFAFKYQIDFDHLQKKYDNQWYLCFQVDERFTKLQKQRNKQNHRSNDIINIRENQIDSFKLVDNSQMMIEYDQEVICLLKNIESDAKNQILKYLKTFNMMFQQLLKIKIKSKLKQKNGIILNQQNFKKDQDFFNQQNKKTIHNIRNRLKFSIQILIYLHEYLQRVNLKQLILSHSNKNRNLNFKLNENHDINQLQDITKNPQKNQRLIYIPCQRQARDENNLKGIIKSLESDLQIFQIQWISLCKIYNRQNIAGVQFIKLKKIKIIQIKDTIMIELIHDQCFIYQWNNNTWQYPAVLKIVGNYKNLPKINKQLFQI